MKPIKIFLTAILLLHLNATNAMAEVVVIVNPNNPIAKISKEEVQRIYLGKDKTFPDKGKARPIDQAEGSSTRMEFYKDIIEKTNAQIKSYWSVMIFTGKGSPPDVVNNDKEVKKWVAENKDGIGYVDSSAVDSSVKVLKWLQY